MGGLPDLMWVDTLRSTLSKLKAQGNEAVTIDGLLTFLSQVSPETAAPQTSPEFQEKAALAQFEADAAHARARVEVHTHFNRFAIETGQTAIRASMLTNGGAAVAMLAFVGNAWGKGMAALPLLTIAGAMAWFSSGVLATAVTSGLAYLTQRSFLQGFDQPPGNNWDKAGATLNVLAIIVVLVSYVLFGRGVWFAYQAMSLLARS
jgi:hypothetical protein